MDLIYLVSLLLKMMVWLLKHLRSIDGELIEILDWPPCVIRYHYSKTRPHIRTGNFADIKTMKAVMKTDEEYFPLLEKTNFVMEDIETSLTYKQAVTESMTNLGENGSIFIGYSIIPGDAMGTTINVPYDQKIETPVAENLMVGLAIGMSFEGFKPVQFILTTRLYACCC